MKLVAISRILDEADIIEAFIRHTAAFAEHHIILDNGSTDGTVEILHSLAKEGFNLSVYQNHAVSFSEQAFMTFMYNEAVREHGADWVACLDGDEFIDDRLSPEGLNNFLETVDTRVTCLQLPWVHYNYTREDNSDENIVPKRMVHRTEPVEDFKVIVSGSLYGKNITIDNGGHAILIDGKRLANENIIGHIRLAHYSERSAFQTIVKFTRGWIKAKAAGQEITSQNISWHYKGPFETLRDRPSDLLRSDWFMNFKGERPDSVIDPINYRGGDLRYTSNIDPAMLAARSLAGYMEALGVRHGELIDTFPNVKNFVETGNQKHIRII